MRGAPGGTAREVEVAPLSAVTEGASVVRLGMAIAVGWWLYLAWAAGDDPAARRLLPYQALIATRAPAEIRVFRELQEGLIEAEAIRSATGQWPAAETLAAEGIPPFAYDPTAGPQACRWVRTQAGVVVNYLGVPERPGAPAWLIVIREPAPGEIPDQLHEDEEHHRLADGTMLHVSTWQRADVTRTAPWFVRAPEVEGWTQVFAVAPRMGLPGPR